MALELVYWIALGVGLGFLAISVIVGEIFEFLNLDIGDTGVPVVPVFFAAVAAFGAGGLLGIEAFGLGRGGSVVTGLALGVVGGGVASGLFALLGRQEAKEGFELSKLVGERGRSTLAMGPGRTGRVSIHYAGMTRSLSATSAEQIQAGQEVVVTDVVGNVLTVSSQAPPPPEQT
jgi:membrane-bound ClpP family serine protease